MKKHAYLILAHKQFGLLKKLVQVLDNPHNDIYIHIDKSAKNFELSDFNELTRFSEITFIKRKKLKWGDFSIVDAEVRLLEESSKKEYSYYHLLSGQDLPNKPMQEIYEFFEKSGKDFLSWDLKLDKWTKRFVTYRFFAGKKSKFMKKLFKLSEQFQHKIGINRAKKSSFTYLKGDQWFSITHPLCKYVLTEKKLIKKLFWKTNCPDESVFQTIAYASPFKQNMCNDSCRYIDWSQNENHPKTLTLEDFDKLQNSGKLFARKFDEFESKDLINFVLKEISYTID